MRKRDKYYASDEFYILHHKDKMSAGELAQTLNLPLGMVKKLITEQGPQKMKVSNDGVTVLDVKLADAPVYRGSQIDQTSVYKFK